ncbi:hypothetical protein ACP70R_036872 [Stipagrostis hirtigluma subsp. patula]
MYNKETEGMEQNSKGPEFTTSSSMKKGNTRGSYQSIQTHAQEETPGTCKILEKLGQDVPFIPSISMAPTKLVLHLLLLCFIAVNATQPPRTLHIPVIHRDAVFPPPKDATPRAAHRLRHAADDARYAALLESLDPTAHGGGRLHSPVVSGLPFHTGEYLSLLGVGTPPTPALVVIDTGSDLVWLQCKPCRHCYGQLTPLFDPRGSTTYRQTPCSSPRCQDDLQYPGCDGGGACNYVITYGDGSTTRGDIATDALVFSGDTRVDNVTLGCGHDNRGLFNSASGLLGLGRGKLSFSAQLAAAYGRVFAYCLGDRSPRVSTGGSSHLVFGRAPEPPSTAFTPLRANPRLPSLYYVDLAGFSVGGRRVTGFSSASLALDPATGRGGVVVDSGTAISRFAGDAYTAVRDAFDALAAAAGIRRLARTFSVFDACYDLNGTAMARVPSIVLHFAGGADMALPQANYFLPVGNETRRQYYCLGLQAAHEDLNVLGNVQQQRFHVVFDVEKGRIGFAPNGCT